MAEAATQRRRWFGANGGELIHGRVFHHTYEGSAGFSLKYYEGRPVRFRRAGRRLELDDLGFLVVNAGEDYAFEVPEPEATRVTTAFFPEADVAAAWASVTAASRASLDDPEATGRPEFSNWLHRARPLLPAALAAVRRVRDEGGLSPDRVDEVLATLLLAVTEAEAGLRATAGFHPLRGAQRSEVLRRVSLARRFIEANAQRDLTLDEMAAAACLSKYYFLRRFREVLGVTPASYLRQVRLERAADLVAGGRRDLTEIAMDCGYADLAAFSRAFTRRYGLAPSRFRRERQLRPSPRQAF